MFTNKTLILALISLGLGMVFLIAENTFYQFVDNEGFLHESMFLPLSVMSIAVGILFLLFFIIQKIRSSFNKK